ncbi:MAG: RnfABCDGE type electron transport complex subunit B [Desulfuromonas sp.]|nr:RnfABCDGE type electron transport complex subunit B [Desulfuromonas sp.]
MLNAIVGLGQIGLVAAIALGWAAKRFAIDVDEREQAICAALPGANCGGCGFPGCASYASAIISGAAPINLCRLGGSAVVENIADIMGVKAELQAAQIAVVLCQGDNSKTTLKYRYCGLHDCNAANQLADGPKLCPSGCLGLGSCVAVCAFAAISISAQGLAQVNRSRCTGCGKCVAICPRHVIRLAPAAATTHVLCSSHDKGGVVRSYCQVGCIGCGLCRKTVPEAFIVDKFLARIDYAHADLAAAAIAICPNGCIVDFSKNFPAGSRLSSPPSLVADDGKDQH